MTKTFNEAEKEFQEVMKKFNNRLIGIDGQILPDSDAEKCKANKDLSCYNKEIERIVKEVEKNN